MEPIQKIEETYDRYCKEIIPLSEEWGRKAEPNEAMRGSVYPIEATQLYELIKENKYKTALQIGTYIGYSGAYIASAIKENNGTFTTIDPNHPHRNIKEPLTWAKKIYEELGLDNVEFVQGYSNSKNSIYDVRQVFVDLEREENVLDKMIKEGRKFDFIFVDGNHDTNIIVQDLEKSKQLLSPFGMIVMHDVGGTDRVRYARVKFQELNSKLFHYEELIDLPAGLGILRWK